MTHGSDGSHAETVGRPPWVFLSNHGYVLLAIAQDPTSRVRDIAASAGLTERATLRIVRELVDSGYVDCRRVGRRNLYRVNEDMPLRHPRFRGRPVRDLLGLTGERPREAVGLRPAGGAWAPPADGVRSQSGDGMGPRPAAAASGW